MNKVSAISTVCKNCLFAIYDGKTQVGCAFNQTDKVDQHDIYELIEAQDEEKEFYILNNYICPYQRTKSWVHANSLDIMHKAMSEVYMPWAAILFYRHNGIEAVEKRISELKNQRITPKVITLVIDAQDIDPEDFKTLYKLMDDNFDIWYLQRVIEKDLTDRFTGDLCFDKMKKHRFMFYTYFDSTKHIDSNYYDKIHKYVIDDMNTYGIIKDGDNIHYMTISKIAHQKYGGNSNGIDIEYKIEYENKDLTWLDITNKKPKKELRDKFIVDYNTL